MTKMATYNYNDKVKFILPADFIVKTEKNDEGEDVFNILAGEYEDNEGETRYSFRAGVTESIKEPDSTDSDATSEHRLEEIAEDLGTVKIKVADAPETYFCSKPLPFKLFGHVMKVFIGITLVRVSDLSEIMITSTKTLRDDDSDSNTKLYKNIYEVIKSVRVDGKKISLDNISPEIIQNVVESSFDEETTIREFTPDGIKRVPAEGFAEVTPNRSLYPHYESLRSMGGLDVPGVTVIVNGGGTEYSFNSLKEYSMSEDFTEDAKALFRRIVSKDTANYDLDRKAKAMQGLFHVNKNAFNPSRDRECELEEGLMHRAYMVSALRSFAWTLAAYCEDHDCTPENIDPDMPRRIAAFVEDQDWLNYDDVSYCTGLCSGSDLHGYFIPDSASQADRKRLLPSDEDFDRVKRMKASFPTYREILSEVHSLDALRADLAYIYPAIEILWNDLKKERDYNEQLTGNSADIVYAWCAFALAAKHPFFTEDGPTRCFFSQIDSRKYANYSTNNRASAAKPTAPTDAKTAAPKKPSASADFDIDSNNVLKKYRGNESSVEIPGGVTEIAEDAFFANKTITSVVIPEGVREIGAGAFWLCDNLKKVVLPSTVIKLCENAFNSTSIASIVIPGGCEKIGADCFTSCKLLTDIYVPASVCDIEDDAFCTFNESTVIHTAKGSRAETFANENSVSVDYASPKSAPSAAADHIQNRSVTNTTTNSDSIDQSAPAKKEGCYIATAVYGSYDAPEVMTLRRFRDETLRNSVFGRWFIRVYYRLSPPIADKLKNATQVNRFVRRILDKFVEKLNRKQ